MITYKTLLKTDLEKINEIDRSEDLDESYIFENGELKLNTEKKKVENWNDEKRLEIRKRIEAVLDGGGIVFGAYDEDKLVGLASLSKKVISGNRVQLVTFHVDRKYRGMGIGGKLFDHIVSESKKLGVSGIYISASSKKRTVDFYLHKGCVLAKNIDEELLNEEPKDIHLEYIFS
jgi:GNAT superfamily N-acetyltransferase